MPTKPTSFEELSKTVDDLDQGKIRSSAPTDTEVVVSGQGLDPKLPIQDMPCRATKGCLGKTAEKVQDIRTGHGRLLRFCCQTCRRSWSVTL